MPIGLALAGLGALGKGLTGLFQGIKANKIDRNNVRPVQEVQQEYFKNVSDAEQAARMGMPLQQYQQALQNQQRNFNGVTSALGRSANSSAGLASLLRASNDATLGLDVQNAQQRVQNQRYLAGQRGILAGQKQNAFDWNQKSKYLAQAAKAQALRGAGAQNLMGAFGDVQELGKYIDNPDYQGNGQSSNSQANMLSAPASNQMYPQYVSRFNQLQY